LYDSGFPADAGPQEEWSVAKKKKAAKKPARAAKRHAAGSPRKPSRPKKTGRRPKAVPRKSARAKKKAAARKSGAARTTAGSRKAAASRVAAGGGSTFSPAGEVYGEESWKEEELSAVELDSDAPELDELEEELESPAIVEEPDDSEW
jgi:hypothetical protein